MSARTSESGGCEASNRCERGESKTSVDVWLQSCIKVGEMAPKSVVSFGSQPARGRFAASGLVTDTRTAAAFIESPQTTLAQDLTAFWLSFDHTKTCACGHLCGTAGNVVLQSAVLRATALLVFPAQKAVQDQPSQEYLHHHFDPRERRVDNLPSFPDKPLGVPSSSV